MEFLLYFLIKLSTQTGEQSWSLTELSTRREEKVYTCQC